VLNVRPVINHHLTAVSRVTSAVVYARQELVYSHIDVLTSLRDPEIRRVDGSVHHHHHHTYVLPVNATSKEAYDNTCAPLNTKKQYRPQSLLIAADQNFLF